jgi:hypothetical protein
VSRKPWLFAVGGESTEKEEKEEKGESGDGNSRNKGILIRTIT